MAAGLTDYTISMDVEVWINGVEKQRRKGRTIGSPFSTILGRGAARETRSNRARIRESGPWNI